MNGLLVTFRKELFSYCLSPVGWVIAVLFYLWRGYEVTALAVQFHVYGLDVEMFAPQTYGFASTFLMVMLVPGVLTMRCFAEERRTGSLETLMTAPVRDSEVVIGKWLAATAFYALLWLPSIVLLHVLEYGWFLDIDVAFGPVIGAYLGMFLLSGFLLSFGCFTSSLTDNVLLAAMLTIIFSFALLQLPRQLAGMLGEWAAEPLVQQLLDRIDVMRNFSEWFARGLIDTSQIVFYVGGIAFFLFLTVVSLSSRRIA